MSLFDFCKFEYSESDNFVGFKYEDGCLQIFFPRGYRKSESEKELKLDIINLISVLSSFNLQRESFHETGHGPEKKGFPMNSYIFLINYYFAHGYLSEIECCYRHSDSGKINWKKTIQNVRPDVAGTNAVYLNFIAKKNNFRTDNLISEIYRYCLHEAFEKIGFLFGTCRSESSSLAFNKNLFVSVIKSKMSSTFEESKLELYDSMLKIIEYLDDSGESKNFKYGTTEFEYVWERLIDYVYGIDDKKEYNPYATWHLKSDAKSSDLRPDTIMVYNREGTDEFYILDSKYYKYGITGNAMDLPNSSSVVKQIAYAQNVEKIERNDGDSIYNAFMIPFNSEFCSIQYEGYATADWLSDTQLKEKEYNKVHLILQDVKSIMRHHDRQDPECIRKLAELIRNEKSVSSRE